MPVIRVSNECYKKILTLQARDGNTMSIFMDRLLTKIEGSGPVKVVREEKTKYKAKTEQKTSKLTEKQTKKEWPKTRIINGVKQVWVEEEQKWLTGKKVDDLNYKNLHSHKMDYLIAVDYQYD